MLGTPGTHPPKRNGRDGSFRSVLVLLIPNAFHFPIVLHRFGLSCSLWSVTLDEVLTIKQTLFFPETDKEKTIE